MPDLHEKLLRFRMNWIAGATDARAIPGQAPSFRFNADDSPRFWVGDLAEFRPSALLDRPSRDFPRFANVASHDEAQRAA
jgi:hypothetical protein